MANGNEPVNDEFVDNDFDDGVTGGDRYDDTPSSGYDNFGLNDQPVDASAIKYQIESNEFTEHIERLLRGQVKLVDSIDGKETYGYPKIEDEKGNEKDNLDHMLMNDYGVNMVMNTINTYINRHLSLSRYDEKRIYEILDKLCDTLSLMLLTRYKEYGMDIPRRRNTIALIVINVTNCVEACYRRSLNGMTFEGINKSNLNSQPQSVQPAVTVNAAPQRSMMNPFNWFRR